MDIFRPKRTPKKDFRIDTKGTPTKDMEPRKRFLALLPKIHKLIIGAERTGVPISYKDGMGREADQQYFPDREKRGAQLSEFITLYQRLNITREVLHEVTDVLLENDLVKKVTRDDDNPSNAGTICTQLVDKAKEELEKLDTIYQKQSQARELVQAIEDFELKLEKGEEIKFKYEFSGETKDMMDKTILRIHEQINKVENKYTLWIEKETHQDEQLEVIEDLKDFINMLMDNDELSCTKKSEKFLTEMCPGVKKLFDKKSKFVDDVRIITHNLCSKEQPPTDDTQNIQVTTMRYSYGRINLKTWSQRSP